MNRIAAVCFHKLKGSSGWSECNLKTIDVAKILEMDYRQRLFCFWDRDKPYTIEVTYYQPHTKSSLAPTYYAGGFGTTSYNETILERSITKRYSSEALVQQEIEDIEKKMTKLDGLARKLALHFIDEDNGGILESQEDPGLLDKK